MEPEEEDEEAEEEEVDEEVREVRREATTGAGEGESAPADVKEKEPEPEVGCVAPPADPPLLLPIEESEVVRLVVKDASLSPRSLEAEAGGREASMLAVHN